MNVMIPRMVFHTDPAYGELLSVTGSKGEKMFHLQTVAAVAIITATCGCTPKSTPPAAARDTANTVSLDPDARDSYRAFAPELARTLARVPNIDPKTGLHASEVKPDLFWVTDGVYQAAFVRTGEGVIVFDAPASLADRLPGVIAAHANGEPVRVLLYSHSHADHIGGSRAFAGVAGLRIVAPASVAAAIKAEAHPGILAPNVTFEDEHTFSLGRESIEIRTAAFHSENTDAIIYVPRQKFIVAVDTMTPGDVPYANFGSTSKFAGYVAFFDEIMRYDFDTILTGHTAVLGTREDVVVNREYVHDVRDTALRGMKTMLPTFEQRFATLDHKNGNLAYRMAIETVRGDCTRQIIDRWKDRLSVVDVWAHTHCETVIQYAIMH
jgi:glyoxylase-like metal-dependent hydrolase (beta-lactamase superfamily II)